MPCLGAKGSSGWTWDDAVMFTFFPKRVTWMALSCQTTNSRKCYHHSHQIARNTLKGSGRHSIDCRHVSELYTALLCSLFTLQMHKGGNTRACILHCTYQPWQMEVYTYWELFKSMFYVNRGKLCCTVCWLWSWHMLSECRYPVSHLICCYLSVGLGLRSFTVSHSSKAFHQTAIWRTNSFVGTI